MQPTTRYRVQPTLLYQQNSSLSVQFGVEANVEDDISNNAANTTVVVREFLAGVSDYVATNSVNCEKCHELAMNCFHPKILGNFMEFQLEIS